MVAPYIRGDVLDVGCGEGRLLEYCRERISSYCGIDRSRAIIDELARRYPEHRFEMADIEEGPLDLGMQFDVVAMVAVVEHVLNQKRLFEQARDALRDGGVIVVTTPTPWGNDIVHRSGAALGLFSPEAAADHCVVYNRQRFTLLASRVGLRVKAYKRFEFGCNQLVVLER